MGPLSIHYQPGPDLSIEHNLIAAADVDVVAVAVADEAGVASAAVADNDHPTRAPCSNVQD